MVRKRTSNEWTTIRVDWEVKKKLQSLGVGRETDNEILKRIIRAEGVKESMLEVKAEYIDKLNRPKKGRIR